MVEDRHQHNYVLIQDYFNDMQAYIRAAHLIASSDVLPAEQRIQMLQGLYWLARHLTDHAVADIDRIEMDEWNLVKGGSNAA